jgi:hypothetical protein
VIQRRECVLGGGVGAVAQSWEQAHFFIRRVLGGRNREVSNRSLERTPIRGSQGPAGRLCRDRYENMEKMLDTSVTVAQQAKRFIETVVRTLTNLDRHVTSRRQSHVR